jgi:hypothetical protein
LAGHPLFFHSRKAENKVWCFSGHGILADQYTTPQSRFGHEKKEDALPIASRKIKKEHHYPSRNETGGSDHGS